jgi:hypothetical protein
LKKIAWPGLDEALFAEEEKEDTSYLLSGIIAGVEVPLFPT